MSRMQSVRAEKLARTKGQGRLAALLGLVLMGMSANGSELACLIGNETPWRPGATTIEQFSDQALVATPAGPAYPLELKDAVREVVLGRAALPPARAMALADAVYDEAKALGYDPLLALAIIHTESHFNPRALSPKGAEGLMQLMPATRRWLEAKRARDLAQESEELGNVEFGNVEPGFPDVRAGVRYFADLKRSFRRLDRALMAYNCGPKRLRSVIKRETPMPFETEQYAERVLRRYHRLQREYGHLSRAGMVGP